MFTLPNALSLTRIPLALIFLQDNPTWRVLAICLALITDGLDGYLARRNRWKSHLGTMLDPLSDKFFVLFSLGILMGEQKLQFWKIASMLCRDFSITLFGMYLIAAGQFARYRFRAIWCGKITTVLQLFVLMALTLHVTIPAAIFPSFIILGVLALVELYIRKEREQKLIRPAAN